MILSALECTTLFIQHASTVSDEAESRKVVEQRFRKKPSITRKILVWAQCGNLGHCCGECYLKTANVVLPV